MDAPLFNFPVLEFSWYGLLSILSLLCFASLSYEVQRGMDATFKADNDDAWKVVKATYSVNFIAMVMANMLFIGLCVGIGVAEGSAWRNYFAGSIFVGGAYWFYTRACEKKLILFLREVGIYSHACQPKFRLKLFGRI